MSERTFGVEIECYVRNSSLRHIVRTFRENGLEAYSHQEYPPDYIETYNYSLINQYWFVTVDGSIMGGNEIKTPILKGRSGFKELRKGLDIIKNQLGGYATRGCGLHVHHGAPELHDDIDSVIRLVKSWNNNRNAITQMVDPSRIHNMYCSPWMDASVQEMEATKTIIGGRRDLNVSSLFSHGTVEVRLHEGTVDADEVESWVRFTQRFIENNIKRKNPIDPIEDPDMLAKRVRVNMTARRQLARKVLTSR